MTEQRIIEYWKQGYSVEQITDFSETVQITKNNSTIRRFVKNKIEKTVLKFNQGEI